MRCGVHGIAAGPDGRCVLCKRAPRERGSEGPRAASIALGLALALLLTGLTLASVRVWTRPRSEPSANVVAERVRTSVEPVNTVQASKPAATPVTDEPATELPALPEPPSEPSAAPTVQQLAPPNPTSGTAAVAPAPTTVATPTPTEAELRAALSAVPIVLFSASWCRVCDKARAFLQANGCSFVERDIDRDAAAHARLESSFGKVSVPVLEIEGRLQRPGFNERTIVAELTRSVERRLGVQGIQARRYRP
jgi:glutaredoxin